MTQLRAEVGERGLAEWRTRAADVFLVHPDAAPESALRLLHTAEDWPRLADQIELHGPKILEHAPQDLKTLLGALPERVRWSRPSLVGLLAGSRVSQGKIEEAVDTYQPARSASSALDHGPEWTRGWSR